MNLLQATTISGLLITGMGVALLGSVKLALARKLQIDEARVGGLVATFGFAMIPVMLTVGFVTDLVGKQPVLIGGSLLMAASLIVLARSSTYRPALLGVLLLSAGWSALINVVNPLSPIAFGGTPAYAVNLACFYFGIGAFVTPLAAAFMLRRVGLSAGLHVLAAFALVTAFLAIGVDFAALTPAPSGEAATAAAQAGTAVLLGSAVMWLCALALFFFAPVEATMGAWATTYLSDQGTSEGMAAGLLSAFWFVYTISRLATALAFDRSYLPEGSEATLIFVLALMCIGVWIAVVLSRGRGMAAALVILAGIIFGPIFPTIMAVLLGHFDPSLHGRAVGLLFAVGGLGWSVLPMLIGAYARRTSVQRAFLLAAASAVGLSVVALILMGQV